MTSGIEDTREVKRLMGKRIQYARNEARLSRQVFVDQLNNHGKRPIVKDVPDEMTQERLKKWEYGENPVNLEWIPAICEVLSCDVGYLFGEYEGKKRIASDICAVTGLTEKAAEKLSEIQRTNKRSAHSDIISSMLESENCQFFLAIIGQSISYNMNESDMQQFFEAEIDGLNVSLFKGTLVNSMIQTHILEEIQTISEIYKRNFAVSPNAREREYKRFHNDLVDKFSTEKITHLEFERLEADFLKGDEGDYGKKK